jgi:hypothetical protein
MQFPVHPNTAPPIGGITPAQIVEAINQFLGSTDWQGGGSTPAPSSIALLTESGDLLLTESGELLLAE